MITSDWISQQIDGIPQGFDISSSILCDHISEMGDLDTVPDRAGLQIDFDSVGCSQIPQMEIDILI